MEFFERQWSSYRAVVEHDLMEHRAVASATDWRVGDLLAWAQAPEGGDSALGQPDILHSAFAIHHLSDAQKQAFLQGARRRINANGVFLWVDVFREPGETREAYIARYCQRIRSSWQPLSPGQQEQVIDHLSQCDIPADRAAIQASAEQAGWRWHWAWQGQYQAEAMAVLTPH